MEGGERESRDVLSSRESLEAPGSDTDSITKSDISVDSIESEDDAEHSENEEQSKRRRSRRSTGTKRKVGTRRVNIDVFLSDDKHKKGSPHHDDGQSKLVQSTSEKQTFIEDQSKMITFDVVRELFVRPNKYGASRNRYIKMTKNPQQPFLVVENDIDYTPKRLIRPGDSEWVREPMLFNFPRIPQFMNYKPDDILVTGRKYVNEQDEDSQNIEYAALRSKDSLYDEDSEHSSKPPSMFPLIAPKLNQYDKMKLTFQLKETDTFILLDLMSSTSCVDDIEGKVIEKSNQQHAMVSKRIRKKMDNDCQTSMGTRKRTKGTQLFSEARANKYAFASNYDYYDTLKQEDDKHKVIETVGKEEHKVGKVNAIKYAEDKSETLCIVETNVTITDKLKWYRTAMIMERLLLSNNAMKRQLVFHDHLQADPYSSNVEFNYELKHLWTLKTNETKGLAVTSMSWNFHEHNILAVGYGKYNFTDKCNGIVCIWNNKNLAHPERKFVFPHPVTKVCFCKTFPDILAIAFYSGWVILVNIVRQGSTKIVARNMSFVRTCVSPVWDIVWLKAPGYTSENIVECRGDGCINQYVRKHLYEKKPIMQISKMKGNVKGIAHPKKCQPYVIPLVRNPAVLCIAVHPENNVIYYVGSDEGGVYKCSLQDVNQHMDMFLAHNGPVYQIQFHPACSKIFLTCGADWHIRIWGDGIYLPLLTMSSGISAVQSAKWSPFNPTIIIAITNTNIEVWDISRRINYPQATYENRHGNFNTDLMFSICGQNLCVGDKEGNVLIYCLSNMPFTPTNADMVLALILIKALTPHRKLLAELIKLGPPFNVSRIYRNFLNLT